MIRKASLSALVAALFGSTAISAAPFRRDPSPPTAPTKARAKVKAARKQRRKGHV